MGKADERENNDLRIKLGRKDTEIADLKAEIAFLVASANGDMKIAYAAFQEAKDQLTDARRRNADYEATISDLQTKIIACVPLEIAEPPATDEQAEQIRIAAENRGSNVLSTPKENVCLVSVHIYIRPDTAKQIIETERCFDIFPGDAEVAKEELFQYVRALVRRAPLPENLRRRGAIPGVDDETLLFAMRDIAAWWHIDDFQQNNEYDLWQRLKGAFDHHIRPRVNWDEITETTAYDYWRKSVEDTFENMAQFRRNVSRKPTKRAPKEKPKYSRISLSRNVT